MELYEKILKIGKEGMIDNLECGRKYKKQLQDLYDFIYVVESTPHPYEPTYSPMFIDCIIHKDLWTSALRKKLRSANFSYDVINYHTRQYISSHLPDTQKRKLLFEMVSQWWFFNNTMSPTYVLPEAIQFRQRFFKGEFSYLPERFRCLVKTMGFPTAVNSLSKEEHEFLDVFIENYNKPSFFCGCFPKLKSAFSRRLEEKIIHEFPILELHDTTIENDVQEELLAGDYFYVNIQNYYDCLDRKLYKNLYEILRSERKE